MLIKVIGSIKEYLRPKGRRPKLVGQGEMCIERICGATFLVAIFESKIGRKGRSKSVLHCTNNPVLESGNLGTYIHRARSAWGTLRCASSIPHQEWVMFSCRCLEEKKCKNPSGCSFITLQYSTFPYITSHPIDWITLDWIRLHCIKLHCIAFTNLTVNIVL